MIASRIVRRSSMAGILAALSIAAVVLTAGFFSSGYARAGSSSCGTDCTEYTPPYSGPGFYTNSVTYASGTGSNSYNNGPYVYPQYGETFIIQESQATDDGTWGEWTYLTMLGTDVYIASQETVQFTFHFEAYYEWAFDTNCYLGSVTGAVAAVWYAGLVLPSGSYGDVKGLQIFAYDTSAPCSFAVHHPNGSGPAPGIHTAGETGILQTIVVTATLAAGYYTPVTELDVYTYAQAYGVVAFSSTVGMGGSEGFGYWYNVEVLT